MHNPTTPVNPCPRCQSEMILDSWRGLIGYADDERPFTDLHHCIMCGHWEDTVIRQNRLLQRTGVTMEVVAA